MPGNRKAAEETLFYWVNKVDPSGKNAEVYKEFFKDMNDEDFDLYINALEQGRDYVAFIMENLANQPITTRNNLEVAKELGHQFFQRVWLTDPTTGRVFLSNRKYLTVHLPVRRQIQTLVHKISIPEDNMHIDESTNQPTGVSKGSALSFPELLVLYSQGHDDIIKELIKYRGGDLKGMNAMNRMINDTGTCSMESLDKLGTTVKATETLSAYLTSMHIENNFLEVNKG